MPFSSSKYLYSWLRISNLVDLSFGYLSFSKKKENNHTLSQSSHVSEMAYWDRPSNIPIPSPMPFQKLCTNLQGFLGFSCSVCIKRRMQTLVRMKYSRTEHAPKRFGALRTAATKQEQSNLSDSPQVKTARTGADLNSARGGGGGGVGQSP